MGDAALKFSLPENMLRPLFSVSNSSTLDETLELLIEASKTPGGRLDLGSKNILPVVLQLCESISYPSGCDILLLSLKLLRNLCAGEMTNQNLFIEHNGVKVVSTIFSFVGVDSDSDFGIIRMGLQLLGNVSLAGERHQGAVWYHFFQAGFLEIARVRTRETSDPLCMVIYTCIHQSHEFSTEICGDQGLPILEEIIRTASTVLPVGFEEDWLKLLLSRSCLEESHFPMLFSKLCPVETSCNYENTEFKDDYFSSEQAFLMDIVSEILNEQVNKMPVSSDVALCVLGILRKSAGVPDSVSISKFAGSNAMHVLKYSLRILRDICAQDSQKRSNEYELVDVIDLLVSTGLLELLLCLLHDLEPPAIIRKAIKQDRNQDGAEASYSLKPSPYRGFRRDLVAVIGNCAYRRKHAQDEIRERNGILLLLQQCVTDEENLFLREWGIWCVRNLLEGNVENQRAVAELELQGSVDVPEIAGLGLRVEMDQKTRRPKLVNVS